MEFFHHPIFKETAYPDSLLNSEKDHKLLMEQSQIVDEQFNTNRKTLSKFTNVSRSVLNYKFRYKTFYKESL